MERRLQVGILSIDGGTNETYWNIVWYWDTGNTQIRHRTELRFRLCSKWPLRSFITCKSRASCGRSMTPKICVSPWRMMVFRHTILDRPTTLLFGDWMLDCRCYPVFWAPSMKVHFQQKVMDLSLIHQKKHKLSGFNPLSLLWLQVGSSCEKLSPSHSAVASAACRDCVQHVLSSTWIPNLSR